MANVQKLAYTFGVEQALHDFVKLSGEKLARPFPGAEVMQALHGAEQPGMLSGAREAGSGVLDWLKSQMQNMHPSAIKGNMSDAADAFGGMRQSAGRMGEVNKELGGLPGRAQGSSRAMELRELAEAIAENQATHRGRGMEAMKGLAAPAGAAAGAGALGYGGYRAMGGGSDE